MFPTRLTAHAGDPYVGMLCYYDIAFCRYGNSARERDKNLVALCKGVNKDEVETAMKRFNQSTCPFVGESGIAICLSTHII